MPLDAEMLEHAVLMEIVNMHPTHLTLDELHLAVANPLEELTKNAVEDSLLDLKRFGLVRTNGEVLEPTTAAVHAAEVILRA